MLCYIMTFEVIEYGINHMHHRHFALLAGAPALILLGPLSAAAQTAPEAVTQEEVATLEKVVATGRPIVNYLAEDALTGARAPTLLRDLPLSVSVVPQELIEDRGIIQLGEALDNVSGAQRKLGYGGTQNFGAYIRGFDQSYLTLRNGLRDFGFYTLRDIANVERFEVLKGPASILYGAVNPGGITNTITKQPTLKPHARFRGLVGSHDRYRGEMDLGGPIADSWGYRLNAAVEDAESFRDGVRNEGVFFAPVLSFSLSERTRLTFEAEYKRSEFVWDLGLPRNPLSFTVPVSRFLGEPDALNDVKSEFGSITLDQVLTEQLRLRAVVGGSRTVGHYNLRSPLAIINGRTVTRVAYDTDEESEVGNAQLALIASFQTGSLSHQLTIGAERYRTEQAYDFLFQPLASIDLYEPVYGAQPGAGFRLFADRIETDANGLYIQDLISIGSQWKLLVGGRYDAVKTRNTNLITGLLVRESTDDAFSPQVGLVYQPTTGTSFYTSFGRSFVPITSGRTATGEELQPERGEQIEIGLKHELMDGRARLSLAAYEIRKENVSTPDPVNPMFRVQTGEQRSRGIEVDLAGELAPGWDIVVAASLIDAEVTRDNRFAIGSALPGAPEKSASLWTKYDFAEGPLSRLSIGGGVYYVDERQAALPNNLWTLPDYTRFDAMAAYDFGSVVLQLNVRNLTDEKIYDLTGTTLLPQEPRSVTLRATYSY